MLRNVLEKNDLNILQKYIKIYKCIYYTNLRKAR